MHKQIYSLEQGALSINAYHTQFKILWDEMLQYRPISNCKCETSKEQCEAINQARTFQQNDQVIRFLTGLNDNYSGICSQILLMDPLPSISRVLFLTLQHERQMTNPTIIASVSQKDNNNTTNS